MYIIAIILFQNQHINEYNIHLAVYNTTLTVLKNQTPFFISTLQLKSHNYEHTISI